MKIYIVPTFFLLLSHTALCQTKPKIENSLKAAVQNIVIDFNLPVETKHMNDYGSFTAIDNLNKIYVVGTAENGSYESANLTITRLTPAGKPDATYGNMGTFRLPIQSAHFECYNIEILKDNSIIICGASNANEAFVVKIKPDAMVDSQFGTNGILKLKNFRTPILFKIFNESFIIGDVTKILRYNFQGKIDSSFTINNYSPIEIDYYTKEIPICIDASQNIVIPFVTKDSLFFKFISIVNFESKTKSYPRPAKIGADQVEFANNRLFLIDRDSDFKLTISCHKNTGELDTTFANKGIYTDDEKYWDTKTVKLKNTVTGNIIIYGNLNGHFGTILLNSKGMPVINYGIKGRVSQQVGYDTYSSGYSGSSLEGNDDCTDINLLKNGKILLSGTSLSLDQDLVNIHVQHNMYQKQNEKKMYGHKDQVVVCLNSNGTIDTTFGTKGKVFLNLAQQKDDIEALYLNKKNNIVVAGVNMGRLCYATIDDVGKITNKNNFVLGDKFTFFYNLNGNNLSVNDYTQECVLYDNNWKIDSTFKFKNPFNPKKWTIRAVCADTSKNYYLCIHKNSYDSDSAYIIKLTSKGVIDQSFAKNGFLSFSYYSDIQLKVDQKSRLILSYINKSDIMEKQLIISRFERNGIPDISFGNTGISKSGIMDIDNYCVSIYENELFFALNFSNSNWKGIRFFKLTESGQIDIQWGQYNSNFEISMAERKYLKDLKHDNNGNLYFSVFEDNPDSQDSVILGKINVNGMYDNTFGTNGRMSISNTDTERNYILIDRYNLVYVVLMKDGDITVRKLVTNK